MLMLESLTTKYILFDLLLINNLIKELMIFNKLYNYNLRKNVFLMFFLIKLKEKLLIHFYYNL